MDGSAEFGLDVKLPGMLYAAIAQCPVLGGHARTVDSRAAEAMPGVRRVLAAPGGVVVVADHFWQALKARDALEIGWDAGRERAARQCGDRRRSWTAPPPRTQALVAKQTAIRRAAIKSAAKSFSAVYELPMLAHATMEPMNCTADVRADRCDLYVGTQVQQLAQAAAAEAAGLAPGSGQRLHDLARRRLRAPAGSGLHSGGRASPRRRSVRR